MMRIHALVMVSLATAACESERPSAQAGATWAIDTASAVVIAEPAGHEFNGVSSALRLSDGDVVVANAGARELALFDSSGVFVRVIGRRGEGPGEFQGVISVYAWHADSVAVYDPATVRWTILDSELKLGRIVSAPDSLIHRPAWLYQGAVVTDGLLRPAPDWMLTVLADVRQSDPSFTRLIRARVDDVGALWVRDPLTPHLWAVHTAADADPARVELPAGFDAMQIGRDYVLGVERDSLDVERLSVRTLRRPNDVVVSRESPASLPTDSTVRDALRALMAAQEIYYADHGQYAATPDSLRFGEPFRFPLFIVEANARRWSAVAVAGATGATCGISIGWPSLIGGFDGMPFCGR